MVKRREGTSLTNGGFTLLAVSFQGTFGVPGSRYPLDPFLPLPLLREKRAREKERG